eukprot:6203311-Pleurochrysis_carterae.AAC.2
MLSGVPTYIALGTPAVCSARVSAGTTRRQVISKLAQYQATPAEAKFILVSLHRRGRGEVKRKLGICVEIRVKIRRPCPPGARGSPFSLVLLPLLVRSNLLGATKAHQPWAAQVLPPAPHTDDRITVADLY